MTVRHQANRKLSKWQLVANGELLIFKMAALSTFPHPRLTNRNLSPWETTVG